MHVAETAASPNAGIPDLCPIVPASCIIQEGVEAGIDAINPFQSFWDAFFVSTPLEAVQSSLELIWAVPRPDFNADWFRDAYQNQFAVIGLAISVLVLIVSIGISGMPGKSPGEVVNAFVDWLWTLLQIAYIPIVSGGILWVSAELIGVFRDIGGLEDSSSFLDLFSTNYFTVGWMSLLTRLLGLILTIEVVAVYLIQIMATLIAPIVIPLRGETHVQIWYVRMWRGVLLGFVPLMMTIILTTAMLVISKVDSVGSPELFQFIGACAALGLAAYLPLKLNSKSQGVVTKVALKMADSRVRFSDVSIPESQSASSYYRYQDRIAQRKERRRELLQDGITVAAAGFTGGATAAAAAASGSRFKTAGRYRRGVAMASQFKRQRSEDGS